MCFLVGILLFMGRSYYQEECEWENVKIWTRELLRLSRILYS